MLVGVFAGCRERKNESVEIDMERLATEMGVVTLRLNAVDDATGEQIPEISASYVDTSNSARADDIIVEAGNPIHISDLPPCASVVESNGTVFATWIMVGEVSGGLQLKAAGYLPVIVTPQNDETVRFDAKGKKIPSDDAEESYNAPRAIRLKRSEQDAALKVPR